MRFLIQRVLEAKVESEKKVLGSISKGLLVFVGISDTDNKEIADKMVNKLTALRIFEDSEGKTNLNLDSVHGELLIVSQFTLYADCKKGNRPSFVRSGNPVLANQLYEYIVDECKKKVDSVQTGSFGANMQVSLLNDGPFTIILDSNEIVNLKKS